jgi:hypothetical protein
MTTTPKQEERDARRRQRRFDKLQRGRQAALEKQARSMLATIIREEMARPRASRCRCGITPRTTKAELAALGEGCTHESHGFICPTLDGIRRRAKL